MEYLDESFELRRQRLQRLGTAVRELAADLVKERRRRVVLEREVRELRTRLAAYEASGSSGRVTDHRTAEARDGDTVVGLVGSS